MNKLILASVAAVLILRTVAVAESAGAPALNSRSPEWKKSVAAAVNDSTKVADIVHALPAADRAAFAADVLSVLQSKRQHMADKVAWANEFGATCAALVSGANGSRDAVLPVVTGGLLNTCVSGESRELGKGGLSLLGVLTKSTASNLSAGDRVAFVKALLKSCGSQKTTDADVHKQAVSIAAIALFSGVGGGRPDVIAEVFADVDVSDLGAVAKVLSDAFNQQKNGLNNEEYQQVAVQVLQQVADRLAGTPDAKLRYAYAVSAFLDAATNPSQFEVALLGKIGGQLDKVGLSKDGLQHAVAAARTDMAGNSHLSDVVTHEVFGDPSAPGKFLTPGDGPIRPPAPGYQNQTI